MDLEIKSGGDIRKNCSEYAASLSAARDVEELQRHFTDVCNALGFDEFVVARHSDSSASQIVLMNKPSDRIDAAAFDDAVWAAEGSAWPPKLRFPEHFVTDQPRPGRQRPGSPQLPLQGSGYRLFTKTTNGSAYKAIVSGVSSQLDNSEEILMQYLFGVCAERIELMRDEGFDEDDPVALGSIEMQALQLLSQGYSLQRISAITTLSLMSVNLIFKSICRKMQCTNMAHVMTRAHQLGYIN